MLVPVLGTHFPTIALFTDEPTAPNLMTGCGDSGKKPERSFAHAEWSALLRINVPKSDIERCPKCTK